MDNNFHSFITTLSDKHTNLHNSTYIVTDATSSLGYGLATELLAMNATVIIACRSVNKCIKIINKIEKKLNKILYFNNSINFELKLNEFNNNYNFNPKLNDNLNEKSNFNANLNELKDFKSQLIPKLLNISDLNSIKQFTNEINKEYINIGIDGLILNANANAGELCEQ